MVASCYDNVTAFSVYYSNLTIFLFSEKAFALLVTGCITGICACLGTC